MSEQSDALKKKVLDEGVIEQAPLSQGVLIDESVRPDLPWVQLPVDGHIASDFNRELGRIIAGKGIYRYRDNVVTVAVNERTKRINIEEMTAHCFRSWVEKYLLCFREQFSRNGALRIKQTMGVEHAETCLQSHDFQKQQPWLLRVNAVRLPILREDGTMELLPAGYDEASCILTIPPKWEYDEAMTAEAAVHVIEDLDREFPFQDERSRAVWRASLFSQFGYHLQWTGAKRLNLLFHANSPASGKTLLVEILLTLAWGWASIEALPDKTKELRDRLDTVVREAKPYIVFDDLDREFFRSGLLNAFMTAEVWSGRKFHAQEDFTEPKSAQIFLTANNLEIAMDQARRLLICDLFTENADVQDREIEREIEAGWIRQPHIHSQLCSALWALVKQWRDGGRKYTGRVVKGYGEWCRIFGGITMAAGFGDPCLPRESDAYGAGEYADMVALITALADGVTKSEEYTFADIINYCRALNCFGHMIKGRLVTTGEGEKKDTQFIASDDTNSAVGKLLGRYGGKSFVIKGGKRAIFDKRGKNRHKVYVIQVSQVGSTPLGA